MRHLRTSVTDGKFVASRHRSNCVTLNATLQVKKGKHINIFDAHRIMNIVSSDNLTLDQNVAQNLNQSISVLETLRVRKEYYSRQIESVFKNCNCFPELKMQTPSSSSEVQTNNSPREQHAAEAAETSQSSVSSRASSSGDESEDSFGVTQKSPSRPRKIKRASSPIFHSSPLDSLPVKKRNAGHVDPAAAVPIVRRGGKDLSVLRELYRQQNSESPAALPSDENDDSDAETLSPIEGSSDHIILTQGAAYSQGNAVRSGDKP